MQRPGLPSNPRLAPFLGLAALVHALLLLLPLPHLSVSAPAPLQLALAQTEAAPSSSSSSSSQPRALPAPSTARSVTPPVQEEASPLPAATSPSAAGATTAAATSGEESAQVITQVRAALARYFVYPLAARRQGWQGEVLIGFSVSREGRIDNVEVVRSSGYRLLDEAARASLTRVRNLPDYASRSGEPLQLRLPVIYRLES